MGLQEIGAALESCGDEAHRPYEAGDRLPSRSIVINDGDQQNRARRLCADAGQPYLLSLSIAIGTGTPRCA
jgi:hypothetical protein